MIDLEKIYITSDLHFFHANIIKYCPNTRGRWLSKTNEKPDILSMNEYILRQFDELPNNSIIINNGDLFLNSKVKFDDIKLLVDRMKSNNKHLWIIMGNHDRGIKKYLKIDKSSTDIFFDLGFERVYEFPILLDKYILSHEPVYLNLNSNFKNKIGNPDFLILFTSTVSHTMVTSAVQEATKNNIPIERSHSSSSCALKKILNCHCCSCTEN